MNKRNFLTLASIMAILFMPAAFGAGPNSISGEKLDNGLGDLSPSYAAAEYQGPGAQSDYMATEFVWTPVQSQPDYMATEFVWTPMQAQLDYMATEFVWMPVQSQPDYMATEFVWIPTQSEAIAYGLHASK